MQQSLLVVTLLIALPFFKLPGGIATGGVIEGFYQGIIPIGYISYYGRFII